MFSVSIQPSSSLLQFWRTTVDMRLSDSKCYICIKYILLCFYVIIRKILTTKPQKVFFFLTLYSVHVIFDLVASNVLYCIPLHYNNHKILMKVGWQVQIKRCGVRYNLQKRVGDSKSSNSEALQLHTKVQWFWNVGYANPKMQYLGVIVLVYTVTANSF